MLVDEAKRGSYYSDDGAIIVADNEYNVSTSVGCRADRFGYRRRNMFWIQNNWVIRRANQTENRIKTQMQPSRADLL